MNGPWTDISWCHLKQTDCESSPVISTVHIGYCHIVLSPTPIPNELSSTHEHPKKKNNNKKTSKEIQLTWFLQLSRSYYHTHLSRPINLKIIIFFGCFIEYCWLVLCGAERISFVFFLYLFKYEFISVPFGFIWILRSMKERKNRRWSSRWSFNLRLPLFPLKPIHFSSPLNVWIRFVIHVSWVLYTHIHLHSHTNTCSMII